MNVRNSQEKRVSLFFSPQAQYKNDEITQIGKTTTTTITTTVGDLMRAQHILLDKTEKIKFFSRKGGCFNINSPKYILKSHSENV